MKSLKSIEKLRESLKDCTSEAGVEPNRFDTYWITANVCDMLIDEVEAEIAERYMELPVDADGVPIRVGDVMDGKIFVKPVKVIGIGKNSFFHSETSGGFSWSFHADEEFYHAKPRTVEDVLREFAYKVCDLNVADCDVERYAAELRELMGGDAE